MGAKKRPFYRIVVADSRAPRDGRFIEILGNYDSTKEPAIINIDEEKTLDWMLKGAQPTDTVKSLLSKKGRIAKAMRTVVKAAASCENKKVTVDIIE